MASSTASTLQLPPMFPSASVAALSKLTEWARSARAFSVLPVRPFNEGDDADPTVASFDLNDSRWSVKVPESKAMSDASEATQADKTSLNLDPKGTVPWITAATPMGESSQLPLVTVNESGVSIQVPLDSTALSKLLAEVAALGEQRYEETVLERNRMWAESKGSMVDAELKSIGWRGVSWGAPVEGRTARASALTAYETFTQGLSTTHHLKGPALGNVDLAECVMHTVWDKRPKSGLRSPSAGPSPWDCFQRSIYAGIQHSAQWQDSQMSMAEVCASARAKIKAVLKNPETRTPEDLIRALSLADAYHEGKVTFSPRVPKHHRMIVSNDQILLDALPRHGYHNLPGVAKP